MKILVSKSGELAAALEWNGVSSFYGDVGSNARAVLARPRWVRNVWSGEIRNGTAATLPATWEWWASQIADTALAAAGYTIELVDIPKPEPLPRGAVG